MLITRLQILLHSCSLPSNSNSNPHYHPLSSSPTTLPQYLSECEPLQRQWLSFSNFSMHSLSLPTQINYCGHSSLPLYSFTVSSRRPRYSSSNIFTSYYASLFTPLQSPTPLFLHWPWPRNQRRTYQWRWGRGGNNELEDWDRNREEVLLVLVEVGWPLEKISWVLQKEKKKEK